MADLITELPDSLRLHILSFLDMKYAVQTATLSTKWKDLWTSLQKLQFNSQLFNSPTDEMSFTRFVNLVLLQLRYKLVSIHRFCIISRDYIPGDYLEPWVLFCKNRKIQEVHLEVWKEGITVPSSLFRCSSLTSLSLRLGDKERFTITLPDSEIDLPNLRVLKMSHVLFADEILTNKFFSGFPNLEELALYDVEFSNMSVNLSFPKLLVLTVDNQQYPSYSLWPNSKLQLHAPGLKSFSCKDFMFKDYILEKLPSLENADIDIWSIPEEEYPNARLNNQIYAQRMMQCVKTVLHGKGLKSLKLSDWLLEVLYRFPDIFGEPTKLSALTCLRLETYASVDAFHVITCLLKISPNLKSVFLEIGVIAKSASKNCHEAKVTLDKLENIVIEGAGGYELELSFLRLLLKNANVLKKLEVHTTKSGTRDGKLRLMDFTNRLLRSPRGSLNPMIVVL